MRSADAWYAQQFGDLNFHRGGIDFFIRVGEIYSIHIFELHNRYGKGQPRDAILRLPFLLKRLRNASFQL
jgi:hypothetical protein